jgi:hypothetical protein
MSSKHLSSIPSKCRQSASCRLISLQRKPLWGERAQRTDELHPCGLHRPVCVPRLMGGLDLRRVCKQKAPVELPGPRSINAT